MTQDYEIVVKCKSPCLHVLFHRCCSEHLWMIGYNMHKGIMCVHLYSVYACTQHSPNLLQTGGE